MKQQLNFKTYLAKEIGIDQSGIDINLRYLWGKYKTAYIEYCVHNSFEPQQLDNDFLTEDKVQREIEIKEELAARLKREPTAAEIKDALDKE